MRWFVSVKGKTQGPVEEEALVAAVGRGEIPASAQICQEGTEEWVAVGKLLPQRNEVRVPSAVRAVRPSGPWMIATTVAAALAVGLSGVLVWRVLVLEGSQRLRAVEQDEKLSLIQEQLEQANGVGTWVAVQDVHHNCYTDRTNVTCTFTNLREQPVQTCTRGMLRQKEAAGIKLESVVICSGRLQPGETRTVFGPWVGGFADDVCYSEKPYVGKSLDWSQCAFTSEPFDLPRARKVNDAVARVDGG